MLKPTSALTPQTWPSRFGGAPSPQAAVDDRRLARAKAQNESEPVGYLARMIKAGGNIEQNAIGHAADVEINALRAIVLKLGGEV